MWKKLNTVLRLSSLAKLVRSTKSELQPFVQELLTELNTLQRQNSQLLAINNSLSQTHTDIGLLLIERQESEGDIEIITEVRALLDKNNAAMSGVVVEADQGV